VEVDAGVAVAVDVGAGARSLTLAQIVLLCREVVLTENQ